VNAQDIKQVPGRKTQKYPNDLECIDGLLRHGLVQASLAPDRPSANYAR
jgi:hypothetical protein